MLAYDPTLCCSAVSPTSEDAQGGSIKEDKLTEVNTSYSNARTKHRYDKLWSERRYCSNFNATNETPFQVRAAFFWGHSVAACIELSFRLT
jgi:hypothetical protein